VRHRAFASRERHEISRNRDREINERRAAGRRLFAGSRGRRATIFDSSSCAGNRTNGGRETKIKLPRFCPDANPESGRCASPRSTRGFDGVNDPVTLDRRFLAELEGRAGERSFVRFLEFRRGNAGTEIETAIISASLIPDSARGASSSRYRDRNRIEVTGGFYRERERGGGGRDGEISAAIVAASAFLIPSARAEYFDQFATRGVNSGLPFVRLISRQVGRIRARVERARAVGRGSV